MIASRRARSGRAALLVTLAALLAGAWPAGAAEPDPLVARVNGHEIRLSHVYRQVEALPLGDQVAIREQLERFAESLVREEILFQAALADGLDEDPELRAAVKAAAVEHLIKRHVRDRIGVSEEAVRAYYTENAGAIRGESVRAAHIRLATRAECEALMAGIQDEAGFRAAAAARSLDRESAGHGGDIGLFMNHGGPYGFETELFRMQPGEMRVFDTAEGCSLVRLGERLIPPLPPFEEVSGRIRALLEARQERALLEALLERAETRVTVERPPTP